MVKARVFRIVTGSIVCGAVALAILGEFDDAPKSPLAWLQYPLLALLAHGLFTAPKAARGTAPLLPFLALSWALGMAVELTLTVDGSGIGGVHPQTFASFVLVQGDYIPLALVIWAFHRWLGFRLWDLFLITLGIGLTEGLIFTGSVTAAIASGSVVGTFLVASYLTALYMVFLLVPFRLCGVPLGDSAARFPAMILLGFAAAFAVRVFWGLVYSPIVTAILDLPPG